jgi:hypothetical protein
MPPMMETAIMVDIFPVVRKKERPTDGYPKAEDGFVSRERE